ncbi:hypothetical protein ACRALDRAFT_1095026 [Sodiomyces alcalophilus JCM 7366]|uniref:uncharacterized protein n=1 Tax=Sodiomyces alcalophilus JCM 7366 TaxID=591952 RepID=UPI0039B51B7C
MALRNEEKVAVANQDTVDQITNPKPHHTSITGTFGHLSLTAPYSCITEMQRWWWWVDSSDECPGAMMAAAEDQVDESKSERREKGKREERKGTVRLIRNLRRENVFSKKLPFPFEFILLPSPTYTGLTCETVRSAVSCEDGTPSLEYEDYFHGCLMRSNCHWLSHRSGTLEFTDDRLVDNSCHRHRREASEAKSIPPFHKIFQAYFLARRRGTLIFASLNRFTRHTPTEIHVSPPEYVETKPTNCLHLALSVRKSTTGPLHPAAIDSGVASGLKSDEHFASLTHYVIPVSSSSSHILMNLGNALIETPISHSYSPDTQPRISPSLPPCLSSPLAPNAQENKYMCRLNTHV